MSLRIEQNWKWSNKAFPHSLFVVSNFNLTTHRGIVLLLTKTCTGHQRGGGREFGPKTAFLGKIFSLKIGLLLRKYFRKQINMKLKSEMENWKWSNKTFHRPCL